MKRRLLVRRLVSVAVLTAIVTLGAWAGLSIGLLGGFQSRATDALFPAAPHDKRVVVVGVDRKSINATQDPLPWSRTKWARLVDQLSAAGASVIVFDVVFATESSIAERGERPAVRGRDRARRQRGPGRGRRRGRDARRRPAGRQARGRDGRARRSRAGRRRQHRARPGDPGPRPTVWCGASRWCSTIAGGFVPRPARPRSRPRAARAPSRSLRPDGVQVGDRFVPTDDVDQHGPQLHREALGPAGGDLGDRRDRRHGRPEEARRQDRVHRRDRPALGRRAARADRTSRAAFPACSSTPTRPTRSSPARTSSRSSDAATLLWVALLTVRRRPRRRDAAVLAVAGDHDPDRARLRGLRVRALRRRRDPEPRLPARSRARVAFIGALGLRYFGETRQRRRVTALFSQYVPETVAQRLVDEDRAELAAEGQRLDMTVLFCDLRGFTALSENLAAGARSG